MRRDRQCRPRVWRRLRPYRAVLQRDQQQHHAGPKRYPLRRRHVVPGDDANRHGEGPEHPRRHAGGGAYGRQTDEDLKAILADLKTMAPVKHRVDNSLPPTLCPRCGNSHGTGNRMRRSQSKAWTPFIRLSASFPQARRHAFESGHRSPPPAWRRQPSSATIPASLQCCNRSGTRDPSGCSPAKSATLMKAMNASPSASNAFAARLPPAISAMTIGIDPIRLTTTPAVSAAPVPTSSSQCRSKQQKRDQ